MKTIPTLREKKRYIAFEVASEQMVGRQELFEEIMNSIHSLFGDTGCSEANVRLVTFDKKFGIMRCSLDRTSQARAALACVSKVQGSRISILVIGISGTIKGAMEKFIQPHLITRDEPERRHIRTHF